MFMFMFRSLHVMSYKKTNILNSETLILELAFVDSPLFMIIHFFTLWIRHHLKTRISSNIFLLIREPDWRQLRFKTPWTKQWRILFHRMKMYLNTTDVLINGYVALGPSTRPLCCVSSVQVPTGRSTIQLIASRFLKKENYVGRMDIFGITFAVQSY